MMIFTTVIEHGNTVVRIHCDYDQDLDLSEEWITPSLRAAYRAGQYTVVTVTATAVVNGHDLASEHLSSVWIDHHSDHRPSTQALQTARDHGMIKDCVTRSEQMVQRLASHIF